MPVLRDKWPCFRKSSAQGDSLIEVYTPMLAHMNLIHDGGHPDSNGHKFLADVYYETIQNLALKQSPKTRWLGTALLRRVRRARRGSWIRINRGYTFFPRPKTSVTAPRSSFARAEVTPA